MDTVDHCCNRGFAFHHGRRDWLKASLSAGAAIAGMSLLPVPSQAAVMSQQQRDALTPAQVLDMLREGNARFRDGTMRSHDFLAQKRATARGQHPSAVILSCIDSRVPAEIIFDTAIGDSFGARIAGNIATDELIGSMEFACAVAGAKLILVLGHTACGAVAGAIDKVRLGNLTTLLERIYPAVELTAYDGARNGSNPAFVDAVARASVRRTVLQIRERSPLLAGLEQQGSIHIIGGMYELENGQVSFLEDIKAG